MIGFNFFSTMSQLETCDLCHEILPLRKVHFDGRQFLCRKCREEEPEPKTVKIPTANTAWKI